MKKFPLILLTALALGACSEDATSPVDMATSFGEAADLAFSASFMGEPGANFLPGLARLPDNLKLSSAQEAQIKALLDAFATATKADRDALAAIMKQAKDAIAAGKTRAEVRVILEQARPIRERLQTLETKLRADILAALTVEQKAWLEANHPKRCTVTLTVDQRNQISALVAAFALANKADLDAIKAALDSARAALRNGASKTEVHAILESARPAMERIHAAQLVLKAAIQAVLTPEQLAAGCALGGMPGTPGMMGGRKGP